MPPITGMTREAEHPLETFLGSSRPDPSRSVEIDGWSFTHSQIARGMRGEWLLNPSLDFSNPCNLNCPYCFVEEKNSLRKVRRPDELSFAESLAVIDDFAAAGAITMNVVGAGEPTVDPHFVALIRHAADQGLRTVVFTNGIAFADHPDLAPALFDLPVTVVLKYNSGYPEIQDALVGKYGYTAKRDRALASLLEHGFASVLPSRLGFDILALRSVLGEIAEIYRVARLLNIVPLVADYIPAGRTIGGAFHGQRILPILGMSDASSELFAPLKPGERAHLHQSLRDTDRLLHVTPPTGPCSYYGAGQCTQLLGVYVDISGKIWPCVARTQLSGRVKDRSPLGDVRQGHLASDVWRSHPYMSRLRARYDGGCPYKAALS